MDQIYKQIVQFQRRCNDLIDDRNSPLGKSLVQSVQKLEDNAQTGKNPRSLEDQVKLIIRLLEESGKENIMDNRHAHELGEECEHLRNQLKKLQ